MERTLVLLKPDTVKRGLIGEVTSRFEKKGLKLVAMKMLQLTDDLLRDHYSHIADKPFFPGLSASMQTAPVIVQCWEGKEAIATVRQFIGVTNARNAAPGTIRGDYSMSMQCNIVHASEDADAAKAELARFLNDNEFFSYSTDLSAFYSDDEQ